MRRIKKCDLQRFFKLGPGDARPQNANDDVRFRGGNNVALKGCPTALGVMFPKDRLQLYKGAEFGLQPADHLEGPHPLKTNMFFSRQPLVLLSYSFRS